MAPLFKIIATAWLLFLFNANPHPNVIVKKRFWQITYSQDLRQPLEVKYEVLCTSKSIAYFSRKGLEFYTEPNINTSESIDYVNNIYDKGHMVPAADFNCDSIALRQTFSYTNCTLQHKDLNRGAWKSLEAYEKELAINNKVTVVIKIGFSKITRMPSGTAIPTDFEKTIYLNGKYFKQYKFPNQSVSQNFEKFLVKF